MLGRGAAWWIAEAEGRMPIGTHPSLFAQLSGRGPMSRTSDEFAWGTELRVTGGIQISSITSWLSLVVSSDVQWRPAGAVDLQRQRRSGIFRRLFEIRRGSTSRPPFQRLRRRTRKQFVPGGGLSRPRPYPTTDSR